MKLAEVFRCLISEQAPIAFRGYDGSSAGPADVEATMEIRSPEAVAFIATAPSDLGLARAYVSGALEVHGDLHAFLHSMLRDGRHDIPRSERLAILRGIGLRSLRRPPLPPEEAPPPWRRGRRHSKERDAASISHHYDVSNRFYEIVLGPSMAYTCAVFPSADATLEQAQWEKFDLVCRKLALEPGQRLLDVGAGWGGMVMHAAEHYGVRALGVTLSQPQAEWAQRAIAERGLAGRAEVRFLDYRDVTEDGFDAVSSIGLTEHIGAANLGSYFAFLAGKLRERGRMLNHTITRPNDLERQRAGPFIDRYVFPDGELEGPGTIVSAMHDNGLELRHEENLREHYAITLREWGANLERGWAEAVREAGERRARVWRLYMAASRVGFDLDRIELHQSLGVRLAADGGSGMPLRADWETARGPASTSSARQLA
ncbi:MAG: class I SAM-dependent methyltransferase [Actinobacteria bacterium]|nr:class I SAM-dependent methyltransferase [Actinomycetota bacterium]